MPLPFLSWQNHTENQCCEDEEQKLDEKQRELSSAGEGLKLEQNWSRSKSRGWKMWNESCLNKIYRENVDNHIYMYKNVHVLYL